MRAGAALVAAGILASRLAGLVRQRVFAHYFGNGLAADAFTAAMRIPNMLQTLFGEGVLSASFIPVYSRMLGEERREEADRVAGAIGAILAVVTAVLVLIGMLAAPLLVSIIVSGFAGEQRELTIRIVRILFPGIGLLVMAAWCLGILNSHRKFLLSYSAPVVWNLAIIAAMIVFRDRPQNELVIWTAWGALIGSALQLVVQLPAVFAVAPGLRFALATKLEGVQTALRNFAPAALSRGVVQISAFIDQFIASWLPLGAVAAIGYAQTLYLLPVSLFGMSVSAAELPEMSRTGAATQDAAEMLRTRLAAGLRQVALMIIPSVVGFIVLGDVVVSTIFETGRFTRGDALYVWAILAAASVGLLAATLSRLYSSTYYALQDTRTPLRYALVRVAVGTALSLGFALAGPRLLGIDQRWGAAGITLGSALAGWLELHFLQRGLDGRVGRARLPGAFIARLLGAAGIAALIAWGVQSLLPAWRPLFAGALILSIYGIGYLALARLFGIAEVAGAIARLRR